MSIQNGMPGAYAEPMPGAMPDLQCTDGRTDGQNGEPPSSAVHLKEVDACEKSGIDATFGEQIIGTLAASAAVCRRRHRLEWNAPRPRTGPCGECVQLVGLVLDSTLRRNA